MSDSFLYGVDYDIDNANYKAPLLNPMFRLEEAENTINVLGYMIESMRDEPIKLSVLQRIAEYAAQYAKDLVEEQGAVSDIPKQHLKDSIKWRTQNNQIQIYSDIRDPQTQYPYAGSVEYGFHPWGEDKFIPPRPFLRPALDVAQQLTASNFQGAVYSAIDNAKTGRDHLEIFKTDKRYALYPDMLVGSRGTRQASMQKMINSRNKGNMSDLRKQAISEHARAINAHRGNFEARNKGAYTSVWKIYGKGREKQFTADDRYIGRQEKK